MSKRPPTTEEELQSLIVEYRMLQDLSVDLQQRANLIMAFINELQAAANTVEEVGRAGDGAEVLVPIGGASYIKAKLAGQGKVVVGLGAGVAVEKEAEEARRYLEERISELQQALNNVQRQLMNVAARMSQIEPRIRAALEAAKTAQGSER